VKRLRNHHPWRRSLRWRIVAAFVLLALATTLVFVGGAQRMMRGGWEAYAKPLVTDYAERLVADLGSPPEQARAEAIVARLPLTLRIEGPVLNWASHPARERRWSRGNGEFDDWGLVRQTADGHRVTFGLAEPSAAVRTRAFSWLTLAALLVLTVLAYAWVRRLLRPLDDIRAGALRFEAGEFGTPIPKRRDDELGDLAGRINAMAASLHGMLEAKRALLLAISHELRSPLTRARVNAELVAEGGARDALLHDLAEMRDLVTDLLESERLAAGHAALQREDIDVEALVAELIDSRFPGRGIGLRVEGRGAAALRWRLDAVRIRLLLRNLVGNALRHAAQAPQPPEVAVRVDGEHLQLAVRDHGPGVPQDQLGRLAEAFWRPDDARSREAGGVGLGLYLCRLVAQAHGGRIEFRNAAPGLEAVVTLPR
jgi:signal transduction histidine kinase